MGRRVWTGAVRSTIRNMIPNNEISKLNPYCIIVRAAGTNEEYVKLIVYKTNGIRIPKRGTRENCVWTISAYAGKTAKSSIHTRLPKAIEARDFFNLLHRIKLGKQLVTPELFKEVTEPHLKQKLIEAACLGTLEP